MSGHEFRLTKLLLLHEARALNQNRANESFLHESSEMLADWQIGNLCCFQLSQSNLWFMNTDRTLFQASSVQIRFSFAESCVK